MQMVESHGIVLRKVTPPDLSRHMLTEVEQLPAIQLGEFLLQVELDEPSEEVREIARKELRETPDVVQPAIAELRRLLQEDEALSVPLESEAWLVRFLRPTKYYPHSAYKLVQAYYGFKQKHAKHYEGLLPSREQNIFKQNILTVLPLRDHLGRRVLVIELGKNWKHHEVTLDEVFKGCVLFLEAAMMEPATQVCGAVVLFDMDGLSMPQVMQFTPGFAKRIVDWLQEAIPLRIKGLYIVNQPYIFNMVFQLFKPFLNAKLRGRIVFVGKDREHLHRLLGAKCLPPSYGGSLAVPRPTGEQWLRLLLMCDQEFAAINKYGYKKKKAEAE